MALTIIERNVQLDVCDHDLTPSKIKAIALDSKTRYVGAEIHNGGQTYDVGQNTGVTLTIIRPDKTGVQVTGEPFQYTVGEGETVYGAYAELTQTALAISGTLKAQFMFTSGEQIIRTEIFTINCGEALDASTDTWAGDLDGHNLDEMAESIETLETAVGTLQTDVSSIKKDLQAVDLVDRTAILFGYLNSTGGEVYPNPANINHEIMTDFIPVTSGKDYTMFWWGTLSGGYWHRLCWYDSSKAFISNSTYNMTQQTSGYFHKITDYTAPSNAAYVRVSVRSYDDGVFSFYTGRINHAEKPNWYDFVNATHVTDSANVKSINHAGYSGTDGAPENTIPAFVQSKAHGFDFIECDTAMTSDGICVCIHDNTIDRTSDGTGNVRDMTYQQLLQYDFGSWKSAEYAGTKIPTLEEVLDVCKALRLRPYIEIKYNGSFTRAEVEQIVDLVRSKCMLDSVTFISFSSQQLGWVMSAYKYARLGLITNTAGDSTVNFTDWAQIRRILQILRNGVNSVFANVRKETIDPTHTSYIEGINKVYSYNFPVECWTVYDTRFWFGRVDKCVSGFTTVTYKYDDWAEEQYGLGGN